MTDIEFEPITCVSCGIVFQVPDEWDESRVDDGRTFWCPNGHGQSYEDSTDEKLKSLERENLELKKQVRTYKCRLIGNNGVRDKIRVWWLGGLSK